ncbi:hypothetical protein ABMA27_000545 [Loxostege sticticalis]|uniref:SEA domain-containing protein n=1 Tax=Loxostege sticticalis TaxID=481309 RepID=A0ABR3IP17_LOXSC
MFHSGSVSASPAEDLYWEGEDDASKEFLEVKNEDIGIGGHLMRIKRDLFDIFSAFSPTTSTTTPEPPLEEISTDDPDADVQDEDLERGSGSHDPVDQDLKEKTLRVTFVVMEPYQSEYSNRDSYQFLSFSKAIADAVNLLYENLPGTQKASLVRIQSRISDEFSCKVTLDIVTTGYDDTDRIAQILQDHIRNRRELGSVAVSDQDFKTNVIDPGYTEPQCSVDEIQCSDDTCVSGSARCDGYLDCPDGSDEQGCPSFDDWTNQGVDQSIDQSVSSRDCQRFACASSSVTICVELRCNGIRDCPQGDDEDGCDGATDRSPTTTVAPVPESTTRGPISCPPGEFSCDETRCVSYDKRCDNRPDCYDGTDEQNCRPGNLTVELHDARTQESNSDTGGSNSEKRT